MSAPIAIDISLDTSGKNRGKGAWDDRDLVRAYDAALEEFHIHHPGPGSWLDKATAAMAEGQPLPGARTFGTSWYSASDESLKRKREVDLKATAEPPSKKGTNPYGAPLTNGKSRAVPRAESPAYAPPSPSLSPDGEDEEQVGDVLEPSMNLEEDAELVVPQSGLMQATSDTAPIPSSTLTSHAASATTYEEALANAISAQYAAGYWFGVAHAKAATANSAPGAPAPSRSEANSNIVHSQKAFSSTQSAKLRR